MKHYLFIALAALIFASCKKESTNHSFKNEFPSKIKAVLKDSLAHADFASLDYSRAVATRIEDQKIVLIRIPFGSKNISEDFVLVQTDENWTVEKGRIIHIEGKAVQSGDGQRPKYHFNGDIRITALNRKPLTESSIEKGYIVSRSNSEPLMTAPPSMEDPYITLPEVIVVSSYSSGGGGISYSTWISLTSFMGNSGGGGGGYYTSSDPSYSGGGGGGGSYSGGSGGTGGGTVATQPTISVDYETVEDKSPIDLQKFINCFSAVPDAGAQCTIEIFTDIPVDSDPKKFFNWDNQSPGHTFIQIKKSNGSNSVMQNIGFYPNKNWKTILSPTAIDGKFVNNGQHEFNASIKMSVSPANFQSMLNYIYYLSRYVKYDIDDYNCTDWALQVFNLTRSDKLVIPKYKIPGGATPAGTNTPQGLYQKLTEMKNSNHVDSKNITTGIVKGWVANSKGPCN